MNLDPTDVKSSSEAHMAPAGRCYKHDVVLISSPGSGGMMCGQIWLLASVMDVPMALVSNWGQAVSQDNSRYTMVFTKSGNPELIPLKDILACPAYAEVGNNRVRTIVPYQLRQHM